jgi:PAS domain S-box-containing protein
MRRLSAADFALAADLMPHVVWMSTADRLVEYVNSKGTDYTGVSAEKLLGWKWILLVHGDDVERVRAARDLAARTQGPIEMEFRLRRFDGQHRWHYLSTRALGGEDGKITKWFGAAIDIEGAKRSGAKLDFARREVEETLNFLESIQANATVGLGIVDRDFRYLRVNEDLAASDGSPVNGHIGRQVAEVIPDSWALTEPFYRQVLETGQAVLNIEFEGSSTSLGGTRRFTESYYPVVVRGETVGVGVVVLDRGPDATR